MEYVLAFCLRFTLREEFFTLPCEIGSLVTMFSQLVGDRVLGSVLTSTQKRDCITISTFKLQCLSSQLCLRTPSESLEFCIFREKIYSCLSKDEKAIYPCKGMVKTIRGLLSAFMGFLQLLLQSGSQAPHNFRGAWLI